MQYYNIYDARTLTREQAETRLSKTAPTGNPTDAQLAADGSLPLTDLPADPEGMCEVAGTRRIEHNGVTAWTVCDYEPLADRDARDAAAAVEAERAMQAAKSDELKAVENKFLLMCDQLSGRTDRYKLGFKTLRAIGDSLDPATQAVLAIQLLAIDSEGQREGGLKWWDTCAWHDDLPEVV
jgi:hypothetical protein